MLVYVILGVMCGSALSGDLPSYITPCTRDDPKLSECIIKAAHSLKDNVKVGIPELGIPAIDPLVIPEIKLEQTTQALSYKVTFVNTTIQEMYNYVFEDFSFDPKTTTLHGKASIDKITIKTNYDIDGKIFTIPITGKGIVTAKLEPSNKVVFTAVAKIVKRKGEEYLQPVDVKTELQVEDIEGHFDGLFNGNEELARVTNQALNENSKEIIKEIIPSVNTVFQEFVKSIIAGVTKAVPYNKLFPPSN